MSPFAGAEAEAKGGQALGDQPAGEAEERAGGPQEDTRAQAGGLINHSLVEDIFIFYARLILHCSLRRRGGIRILIIPSRRNPLSAKKREAQRIFDKYKIHYRPDL